MVGTSNNFGITGYPTFSPVFPSSLLEDDVLRVLKSIGQKFFVLDKVLVRIGALFKKDLRLKTDMFIEEF